MTTEEKIDDARKEAEKILRRRRWFTGIRFLGDCHIVWNEQKRILKEKYNIDWKTPAEENPNSRFD